MPSGAGPRTKKGGKGASFGDLPETGNNKLPKNAGATAKGQLSPKTTGANRDAL